MKKKKIVRKAVGASYVPQVVQEMGEMLLGDRLKDLRLRRKWSLEEVARRAGVDKSHVWKLEQGQFSHPRPETLAKIAKAFEMPVKDLIAVRSRPGLVLDSRIVSFAIRIGELPPRDRQLMIEFVERAVEGFYATTPNSGLIFEAMAFPPFQPRQRAVRPPETPPSDRTVRQRAAPGHRKGEVTDGKKRKI
jgi:transcriptional regulator with XRE-family HTH domain